MKVLIIDDEALVRRVLVKVAQSLHHETQEAQDGEEGEKKWLSFQPHLVFLDILMPKKTGLDVMKNVQGQHSSKIVLMSAFTEKYNLQKAQKAGAHLFLPKPFENIFECFKRAEKLLSSLDKNS